MPVLEALAKLEHQATERKYASIRSPLSLSRGSGVCSSVNVGPRVVFLPVLLAV